MSSLKFQHYDGLGTIPGAKDTAVSITEMVCVLHFSSAQTGKQRQITGYKKVALNMKKVLNQNKYISINTENEEIYHLRLDYKSKFNLS